MQLEEKVQAFLFARWMSTCYADEHIDHLDKSQHEFGYEPTEAMSVLNRAKGDWWKDKLEHFGKVVLPNYIQNGSYQSALEFLE